MTKHVEIRQAGRSIAVPEGVTILEAALADGIASYPHGCRSGRCGSCKSRLVSVEVDLIDHSRFPLSDEEKAQGLILACRAIPDNGCDRRMAWQRRGDPIPSAPPSKLPRDSDSGRHTRHQAYPARHRRGRSACRRSAGLYCGPIRSAHVPGRSHPRLFDGKRAGRAFEFHIRRVPGGAATQRIHALLKLGDPVLLEGPFGSSYLREQHAGPILCVAGGSGLAPIKGIVEAAIARGMKQPIHVYFGARSDRDLYFVDHFEGLAQRHPNLTFTPVLSDAPLGRAGAPAS